MDARLQPINTPASSRQTLNPNEIDRMRGAANGSSSGSISLGQGGSVQQKFLRRSLSQLIHPQAHASRRALIFFEDQQLVDSRQPGNRRFVELLRTDLPVTTQVAAVEPQLSLAQSAQAQFERA